MGFSEAVQFYYPMFGFRGVCLATLARLARSHPSVALTIDGIDAPVYVRWRTSDLSVFRQVFLIGEYDYEVPSKPRVIVDAGANIGLVTILYANKYPHAKILAIEPESSNFEVLLKNVRAYPQVTPLKAALWGVDSDVQILDPGLGNYGFRIDSIANAASTGEQVRGYSVASIISRFGLQNIDLLKVDIEGAEEQVFEQCGSWIDRVGSVAIETHDHFRPRSSETVLSALVDFDIRWRVGEILYFTRSSLASDRFGPGATRSGYRGHHIVSMQRDLTSG